MSAALPAMAARAKCLFTLHFIAEFHRFVANRKSDTLVAFRSGSGA